jgi:hypothetical protein
MSHVQAVTQELREAIEKAEEVHSRFDRKIPKRLYRLIEIAEGKPPSPFADEEKTGAILVDPFPAPRSRLRRA